MLKQREAPCSSLFLVLKSNNVRLKRLDDVDVQKLHKLQNWDRDTHDAILWLRQNKHRFKMEVFEPPLMCLTVPKKQFINAVESCFSAPQLKVSGVSRIHDPVPNVLPP